MSVPGGGTRRRGWPTARRWASTSAARAWSVGVSVSLAIPRSWASACRDGSSATVMRSVTDSSATILTAASESDCRVWDSRRASTPSWVTSTTGTPVSVPGSSEGRMSPARCNALTWALRSLTSARVSDRSWLSWLACFRRSSISAGWTTDDPNSRPSPTARKIATIVKMW